MSWKSVEEAGLGSARVFLRADLNVPLSDRGAGLRVADDTRIRAVIPTIRHILDHGASLVLASHLGRPGGRRVEEMSLAPVAEHLSSTVGLPVLLAPDCVGRRVEMMADSLEPGRILLLENLRFHEGETGNDPSFAQGLASLADIYVNDAFGTCHRDHASMTGVPRILGGGYAGLLLQRELETFERLVSSPSRPFTLLIENLMEVVDNLLIGGGMAFTFLAATGLGVGESLLDGDRVELAGDLLSRASRKGMSVALPVDVVVSPSAEEPRLARPVDADSIPSGERGLDIGPRTISDFSGRIASSGGGTVFWNGPMGMFEVQPFDRGTREMALALAGASRSGNVTTIVGGGDSVRAVSEAGVAGEMSFISTGGGASLKLLQGKELVALSALSGG